MRQKDRGTITLSANEAEAFHHERAVRDRIQRILAVRERERTLAKKVRHRYRQNLSICASEQRTHAQKHDAQQQNLLSDLTDRFHTRCSQIGSAQRKATQYMTTLQRQAASAAHCWDHQNVVHAIRHTCAVANETTAKRERIESQDRIKENLKLVQATSIQKRKSSYAVTQNERERMRIAAEKLHRNRIDHGYEVITIARKCRLESEAFTFTRAHCENTNTRAIPAAQEPSVKIHFHKRSDTTPVSDAYALQEKVVRERQDCLEQYEENRNRAQIRANVAAQRVQERDISKSNEKWLSELEICDRMQSVDRLGICIENRSEESLKESVLDRAFEGLLNGEAVEKDSRTSDERSGGFNGICSELRELKLEDMRTEDSKALESKCSEKESGIVTSGPFTNGVSRDSQRSRLGNSSTIHSEALKGDSIHIEIPLETSTVNSSDSRDQRVEEKRTLRREDDDCICIEVLEQSSNVKSRSSTQSATASNAPRNVGLTIPTHSSPLTTRALMENLFNASSENEYPFELQRSASQHFKYPVPIFQQSESSKSIDSIHSFAQYSIPSSDDHVEHLLSPRSFSLDLSDITTSKRDSLIHDLVPPLETDMQRELETSRNEEQNPHYNHRPSSVLNSLSSASNDIRQKHEDELDASHYSSFHRELTSSVSISSREESEKSLSQYSLHDSDTSYQGNRMEDDSLHRDNSAQERFPEFELRVRQRRALLAQRRKQYTQRRV